MTSMVDVARNFFEACLLGREAAEASAEHDYRHVDGGMFWLR